MTDWAKLKVVDLKKELSARGLLQTGLKQDLINRLIEDDEKKAADATEHADDIELDALEEPQSRNGEPALTNNDGADTEENHNITNSLPIPGSDLQENNESLLHEKASAINSPAEDLNASAEGLEGSTLIEPAAEETEQTDQSQNTLSAVDESFKDAGDAMAVKLTPGPREIENDGKQKTTTIDAPSEEIVNDSQKRKRRSLTPDILPDEALKKRMRHVGPDASDDHKLEKDEVTTTKDDAGWVEKHNGVESSEVNAEAMEVGAPMEGVETSPTIVDIAKEEVVIEQLDTSTTNEEGRGDDEAMPNAYPEGDIQNTELDELMPNAEPDSPTHSKAKDGRFKDLFPASKTVTDDAMEGVETDRIVSPAIHPATTALYIRGFMRPLNSTTLKDYLTLQATPPSSDTDSFIIKEFYVDPIRTHAYVSFSNISAASRVRSAIHGTIWPEETNRKPLWADFIPAEKVQDWIEEEKSSAGNGRTGGKKFEIAYEDDYHGDIIAVLREADPRNVPARQASMVGIPSAPRSGMAGVPLGPRSNIPHDIHPYDNRNADMPRRSSHFTPVEPPRLESGFKTTTSMPRLYYQPVSKELVKKRLDSMDRLTREDYRRDEQAKDIHRYTFEDGDKFVDRGPEVFEGIRPPRGLAGRYRGGGSGGGGSLSFRERRDGRRRERDTYTGGGSRYSGGGASGRRVADDGYRGAGTRRY